MFRGFVANYYISTVVSAVFVPPAFVVHVSTNFEFCVSAGVFAAPETDVLFLLASVNAGRSGLEMTQLSIAPVTHPMFDVSPLLTFFGFATSTIDGLFTFTVHCALSVCPWFEHVRL